MGVRDIGTLSDKIKDVECISVNGLYENSLILCLCVSESEKCHFFTLLFMERTRQQASEETI